MRPRKLAMCAFGPFADRVEIDFAAFGASNLLLIHGPTGAGKSSILDAIAFALYGESSGGERAPRDIRSHFAGPDETTEVELELDADPDRYRVRRRPEQELAKQRGDGTTIKKSGAELEIWDDAEQRWRLTASGTRDVDAAVERIVGIEAAHFRQVVVLPQGQFRRLLTADSAERERILATLFETARFERVQDELRRRALELRRSIAAAETRRATLLADHDVADDAGLEALVADLGTQEVDLATQLAAAREAESAAGQQRDAARETTARLAAVDEAARTTADLETRRAAMDAARTRLAAARRAAGLADLLGDVARRRDDRAARTLVVSRLEVETAAADDDEAARSAALDAAEARGPEREAARREAERLAGLESARAALESAEQELEIAAAARAAANARADKLGASQQDLDGELTAFDSRLADARDAADRQDAVELELRRVEIAIAAAVRRHEATTEAERLAAELATAAERRDRTAVEVAAADARLSALRAAAARSQAAHLARGLIAGEPCPVCGSSHHPAPAAADDEVPDPAAITALEEGLASGRRRSHRLTGRTAELTGACQAAAARIEAATETLGELATSTRDELEARRIEAVAVVGRARDAAVRVAEAARGREQLVEQQARTSAELEHAKTAAQEAAASAASAAAVVGERRRALAPELRERAALQAAADTANERYLKLTQALERARHAATTAAATGARLSAQLAEARRELDVANEQLEQRARELDARRREAGFEDEDELRAATMAATARDALEAEVTAWELAVAAAADALARARERATDLEPPDLAAIEAAHTAARDATERLAQECGTVRARLAHTRRTVDTLAALAAEIAADDARHEVVGELAEVATDRSMPFSRYVLAAMLDEVLLEASLRLAAMSRGRYALRRESDHRDRRRSGGLDLVVFDAHTGVERPVETLSGGEGFLASLSLALGLADVVQRHSGGVRLDTVFIDEGFGSLDPEALDLAWETLLDLHATGRLVGVISHVPDLKERIPARIEVIPGARGATVRVVA